MGNLEEEYAEQDENPCSLEMMIPQSVSVQLSWENQRRWFLQKTETFPPSKSS